MKTVFLLRHAKSSWDDPSLTDHRRPLAPRGRKAAPRMGAHMADVGFLPDLVLSSTARRAVETWELVSQEIRASIPVEFRDDLYHASPNDLLSVIRDLPDSRGSVLLVGHNPTFHTLALGLAGSGEGDAMAEMTRKYPTGALAVLDFSVDFWSELQEGEGHLRDFIRPKALKS